MLCNRHPPFQQTVSRSQTMLTQAVIFFVSWNDAKRTLTIHISWLTPRRSCSYIQIYTTKQANKQTNTQNQLSGPIRYLLMTLGRLYHSCCFEPFRHILHRQLLDYWWTEGSGGSIDGLKDLIAGFFATFIPFYPLVSKSISSSTEILFFSSLPYFFTVSYFSLSVFLSRFWVSSILLPLAQRSLLTKRQNNFQNQLAMNVRLV